MSEEKNAKKPAASKAAGKNKIENSKSKAKPAEKKTNSQNRNGRMFLKKFRTENLLFRTINIFMEQTAIAIKREWAPLSIPTEKTNWR